MRSDLGEFLRNERQRRGLSVRALALKAGISHGTVSNIELSKGVPDSDSIEKIAAALDMHISDLMEGQEQLIPIAVLAARIPASDAWPTDAEYVPAVAPADHLVGVRVKGDCMAPKIEDGDTVVVDKTRTAPELGRVVVWWSQGAWTLKRLRRHNGTWLLVPDNPNYPPIEIDPAQSRILGVVIRVVKPTP